MRDFSAKYKQSALGFAWVLIMPIVTVGMFVAMSHAGILNIGDVGVPYPLYAIIGLSIWTLFSGGIMACSSALVGAGSMVAKINFPKISLVIAATGQSLVDTLIRMVLIAFFFIFYQIFPDVEWVFMFIISMIPIFFLMLGIGFIMSLFTVIIRDILTMLHLAFTGLMLLTPVVYPISEGTFLAHANLWNPLNYLVNVPRDLIMKGNSELIQGYIVVSLFSIAIFYIGWRLFYLAQAKVVERI